MTNALYPYTYTFHGLNIASQIELVELLSQPVGGPAATSIDVSVELGTVDPELPGSFRIVEDYQVLADEVLLTIPTVGRYLARGGHTLIVEPACHADLHEVQLYLIGSGLAAILHQRELWPLHACAFEFEGECIACLGDSGAGKSTLAAMLSQRGFRLMTDDVLVIRTAPNGDVLAEPSLPILKLWPQSLDASGLKATTEHFESADYQKYRVAVPDRFTRKTLPLTQLYFLRWLLPVSAAPELVPLNGLSALMALRANIYSPSLVGALGHEQKFMDAGAKIISRARAFEFRRAMSLANADAQVDALLQKVEQAI